MNASAESMLLVVDDDVDDCELVREALSDTGYPGHLAFATDGVEMLEYLEGCFTTGSTALPDLILLDLNMPRMDGLSALIRLKADERFSDIPVLILSTSRAPENISRAYSSGAQTYLTKPSRFSDLVAALSAATTYWFRIASLPEKKPHA